MCLEMLVLDGYDVYEILKQVDVIILDWLFVGDVVMVNCIVCDI